MLAYIASMMHILLFPGGGGGGTPDNGLVHNGVPLVENNVYLIETD